MTKNIINFFFSLHKKIFSYIILRVRWKALTVFITQLCPGCEHAVTTENCEEKRPFKNLKQLRYFLSFVTPVYLFVISIDRVDWIHIYVR